MNVTSKPLPLVEGAGGCSCCRTDALGTAAAVEGAARNTQTFLVTGLTCGRCAAAVSAGVEKIDGVTEVSVALVTGGPSMVTVRSESRLSEPKVAAALEEAGNYRLASASPSDSPVPGGPSESA